MLRKVPRVRASGHTLRTRYGLQWKDVRPIHHGAKQSTVEIGGVVAPVKPAQSPGLVPRGYLPDGRTRPMSQELLNHLRWMIQKDRLNQDIFLIGPPGASRRVLSMQFCELLNREVEYVSISQDTTESDLKQRREIVDGAAIFTDQAPVRAAINGRVLVIDGLERAERNVLPTLNNLLENREMTLDDGRFLMKAETYDNLLTNNSSSQSTSTRLVRVHPDFRVIALGLPVPPYPGRPLDPPLRSRFQARSVLPSSPGTQLEHLVTLAPDVPIALLEKLVGVRESINAVESLHEDGAKERMPYFDYTSIAHAAHVLQKFPEVDTRRLLQRVFPLTRDVMGPRSSSHCESFDKVVDSFLSSDGEKSTYSLQSASTGPNSFLHFSTPASSKDMAVPAPIGTMSPHEEGIAGFIQTATHESLISEMAQDHAAGSDLCIVGEKGSGKSGVARLFAHRLGYATELFSLFKDMTSRDLLQRRATDVHGNTIWEDSPLVHAAKYGHLVILDGIHRLGSDSLGILQRLVQDRELELADGGRLLAEEKFNALDKVDGVASTDRVSAIHPSFRIVAIAETDASSQLSASKAKHGASSWLTSDSISMFAFHKVPSLSSEEKKQLVQQLYPKLPHETSSKLLQFAENLEETRKATSDSEIMALSLTLRQTLRCSRRLAAFPEQSLADLRPLLHDTLMTSFLPASCVRLVDTLLDDCGVPATSSSKEESEIPALVVEQKDGQVRIGDTQHPVQVPEYPELVPQPQFFDIPKHTETLRQILQDIVAGQQHILLIGNQGVGKNKIADRLLQLLQQEREYIQLHRDTTVQTLTLVPTLENGRIIWEDSPLVRAAKFGRTLLVDEADKAPLEVVCVLKGLIEDGEMLLGNGKRLVDTTKVAVEDWRDADEIIPVHPDFRMWVLANRPGYPFLGNNFFREIGDVFSSHAIDNPDEKSELALLQAYAPNVSVDILKKLCRAFSDLRALVDEGAISYPYSTREAVAVAKHLEEFPDDGVTSVLENVLAFDSYDKNLRKQLAEVFIRHDIPLSSDGQVRRVTIDLSPLTTLPESNVMDKWKWTSQEKVGSHSDSPALYSTKLRWDRAWIEPATSATYSVQQHRLQRFSEEVASFQVPLLGNRKQEAHAIVSSKDNSIHVLTRRPMALHTFSDMDGSERTHTRLELESQFMHWEESPVLINLRQSNQVAAFLPSTGLCIRLDPTRNTDGQVACFRLPEEVMLGTVHTPEAKSTQKSKRSPFPTWFDTASASNWVARSDPTNAGTLLRFERGGNRLQLIDIDDASVQSLDLQSVASVDPDARIMEVQPVGSNQWLVRTSDEHTMYYLQKDDNQLVLHTANANTDTTSSMTHSVVPSGVSGSPIHTVHPSMYLQTLHLDTNEGENEIECISRDSESERDDITGAWVSKSNEYIANVRSGDDTSDLEVTYPSSKTTKTIPLHPTVEGNEETVADATELSKGDYLATVSSKGRVRLWQLESNALDESLDAWKKMFGPAALQGDERLQLKVDGQPAGGESTPKTGLDEPKYGKDDPNNDPHVGGNTWAGGSGGSDTAGLGGRGGPYRLDKGHAVHQVSQEKKDEVSDEMRAKARAFAEEALASKLQEIDMSNREWESYQRYLARVEQECSELRSILNNVESMAEERSWLKHQSSGELDDSKLVDGVSGERLIFKRRGVSDSPFSSIGSQDTLPKRLLFVMDVSGSMYRFNGQDGRLERVLETTLMIMESFAGFEDRFDYSIVGHSGNTPEAPFVDFGAPPADRKERLKVLQRMVAHTQYCMSGDNTVEAVESAVKRVVEEDADDYLVVVVSDANLQRYGIEPAELGDKLVVDPQVQAHAVFIASFTDEADTIKKELPDGRGHVCLDTTQLPRMFKTMFTSAFGRQ